MCSIPRQNNFYGAMAAMGEKDGNDGFANAVRSKMTADPNNGAFAEGQRAKLPGVDLSSPASQPSAADAQALQASRSGGAAKTAGASLGGRSTILTSGSGIMSAAASDKKTLLGQ